MLIEHSLPDSLSSTLPEMGVRGEHLGVGLSGGVDSVALLSALHLVASSLGFSLSALHVHHGLSPHADAWAALCERICASLSVPLITERVCVARDDPRGLEAAARQARYQAYARGMKSIAADSLVLAHHRGDQAETVMHRLIRGAGVRGCAAMRSQTVLRFDDGHTIRLLRPLLEIGKDELERHARDHGLDWVTDETNANPAFARNFLRAEILPRLNHRFPGADQTISRAAGLFAEAQDLLVSLAQIDLSSAREGEGLTMDALQDLGPARVRNLLRCLLEYFGVLPPPFEQLDEALRQLLSARPDRSPQVCWGGLCWVRFDSRLYCVRQAEPGIQPDAIWQGEPTLPWSGGMIEFTPCTGAGIEQRWLLEGGLQVRSRRGQERIMVALNRPSRSLKQLFQARRAPPWAREAMPLFWCGEALLAVGDIALDPRFACPPGAAGLKISWRPWDRVVPLSGVSLGEGALGFDGLA